MGFIPTRCEEEGAIKEEVTYQCIKKKEKERSYFAATRWREMVAHDHKLMRSIYGKWLAFFLAEVPQSLRTSECPFVCN